MYIQIAGYLSGIAILLSFYPYIRDIFFGKTKPERMSWAIWATLSIVSFFPQLAKGASYSLFLSGTMALGDLFVFILSIRMGIGGFLKRDVFAFVAAAAGLILWFLTKEASYALYLIIFVDALGAILTVIKSYEHPETETISNWLLTGVGGFFACIAVGGLNFVLLSFPVYITLASFLILLAIRLGYENNKVKLQKNSVDRTF